MTQRTGLERAEIGRPDYRGGQETDEDEEKKPDPAVDQGHPDYPPLELLAPEEPELPEVSVLPEEPPPEELELPEVSVLDPPVLPDVPALDEAPLLLEEPLLPDVSPLDGEGSWAANWLGAGAWRFCSARPTLAFCGTKLSVVGPGMTMPIRAARRSIRA
jgi:hypothetical protein